MSGPEFLALAWRLPAYDGVIAARIRAEEEEQEGPRDNGPTGPRREGPPVRNDGRRVVDIHDPVFAGYIDWG